MKDRFAQAVYVLGCMGAVVLSGMVVLFWIGGGRGPDPVRISFTFLVFALGSYGAGWAIRYILSGTTTSVLDYVRK